MANQFTPLIDRFSALYIPEPNSGCWLWTGHVRVNRYGDIRPCIANGGRPAIAYRVSWELANGPIPASTMVCHKCDVSLCVNPDHLYLGDHVSNALDSIARGRHNSQRDPDASRERGRLLASIRKPRAALEAARHE